MTMITNSSSVPVGAIDDPNAEHKRSDFFTLRDINLDAPDALTDLALCYKYWIALTDCDGFRGSSRVDLQACKLGTGRRFTTS
jgi:hypothetical protein